VRKQGKLPFKVYSDTYELEYGTTPWRCTATLCALAKGPGGGRCARHRRHRRRHLPVVGKLGAQVIGFGCILELGSSAGASASRVWTSVALVS